MFLSYARSDRTVAVDVAHSLEQSGFTVWWDREIRAGADFALEIDREIAAARAVVVLWSDASQQSPWVRDEGAYARDRQKLVPICLDSAEPPLGFRQMQSLRLRKGSDRADTMAELVSAVRGLVSGEVPARSVAEPSRAPRRKRALIAAAAAFVALLLTGLLVRTQMPDDAVSPKAEAAPFAMAPHVVTDSEKSIAVLPFADMSEKRDQEFLADGMTEEIINLLANAPDLLVSARTSSFYFKGKATKLEEIGQELGVAHILEGSIRRLGDRLRVTAQLVRADSGFHLWSETYDRELRDLFVVQGEIANSVAQALQIRLRGGELNRRKGGTQNLEAYEFLLKAYHAGYQNTATSFDEMARYAQEAIDRDPNYGLAWSQLAYAYSSKAANSQLDWNGYVQARELAGHALKLSPDIAEAHALLGSLHVLLDWDWVAADREFQLALVSDPTDPNALQVVAMHANARGKWDEAERLLLTAFRRDPLSSYLLFTLGNTYYGAGRFDEAETMYQRLAEVEPNFQWARMYLGKTLQAKGDIQAAFELSEEETDPALLAYTRPIGYWMVGRKAESDAALQRGIELYGGVNAWTVAQWYAFRGERDLAFEWLDKAYEQKNSGLLEIVGEPLFKNLCGDPRFDTFMRKMGMPLVTSYPYRAQ